MSGVRTTGAAAPTLAVSIVALTGIVITVAAASLAGAPGREAIRGARIDAQKRLAVTLTSGRVAVVPLTKDQTGFTDPVVSRDGTAVGAQAQFANCCTSYDLPLQLVIYRDGRTHRFTGNDLPIFDWHFANAGSRVAYGQQPAHGACIVHYELRDIDSERLLDSADVPEPCGLPAPDEVVEIPLWVKQLLEDGSAGGRP